jgi:hypothetical protein
MGNELTKLAKNMSADEQTKKGDCKFCGKEGLLILPLRYGTLPIDIAAPALPIHCALSSPALTKSKYALRMVRDGYVYLLVERVIGRLDCQAYVASGEGYLARFPAYLPPAIPPKFTCDPNTCGSNASMIAIPLAHLVERAYLFFSAGPITPLQLSKLCDFTTADKLAAEGVMVKFSPSAWVNGSHTQTHSVTAEALPNAVVEFALFAQAEKLKSTHELKEAKLSQTMFNVTFPLMVSQPDENVPCAAVGLKNLTRLASLRSYMLKTKAMALSMPDPIGIVQELNDHRNDALSALENLNLTQEPTQRMSNGDRFKLLQQLKEVQANFEGGTFRSRTKFKDTLRNDIRARWEPVFADDSPELVEAKRSHWTKSNPRSANQVHPDRNQWRTQNPSAHENVVTQIAAIDTKYPESWTKDWAKNEWNTKYGVALDTKAMDDFEKMYEAASDKAMQLANERVDDFLKWLVHPPVVQAFNSLFDRTDKSSGFAFQQQVDLCLFGMSGVEKSAAVLDNWLKAPSIEDHNLFLRGFVMNQTVLRDSANEAFAAATAAAAGVAYPAALNGEKMYAAFKKFTSAMKSADSAWDEFVRNQTQKGVKAMHQSWEGRRLFQLSEMTRGMCRAGMGKVEVAVVARLGGLVHACTGKIAESLRFNELMYRIDPEQPFRPKAGSANVATQSLPQSQQHNATGTAAADAQAQARIEAARGSERARLLAEDVQRKRQVQAQHLKNVNQRIEEAMAEVNKDKVGSTNNYHQVRIGVAMAGLEAVSFFFKLRELQDLRASGGHPTTEEELKLLASGMTLTSMVLDTTYSFIKSVREKETNAALKGAGDVLRGGFKLAAGTLAFGAGLLGVGLEIASIYGELKEKKRPGLVILSFLKGATGVVSTYYVGLAAFSYSGPMFEQIALRTTKTPVANRLIVWLALKAGELAERVAILRWVARWNWVGLTITGVEILGHVGYAGYMHFQPTEFEEWCKRSQFAKRVPGKIPFSSFEEEMTALAKATKETPELTQ